MEEKKIDWEQRRYEIAKAAMQGFCSNSQKQFINVDSSIKEGNYIALCTKNYINK